MFDIESGCPMDHALVLPIGSIIQTLSGRKQDSELFYYYSSFISPGYFQTYICKVDSLILLNAHSLIYS